ncbi:MAG: YbhB/YbcL family Raf kinase inhibitor-like protein [Chitinivibrionales bacterium]
MRMMSPDFENEASIPSRNTCDGENLSPELIIEHIPQGTASLVLIMEDPDSSAGIWDHWICYDIPPLSRIGAGQSVGKQGINSFDNGGYGGPCPSSGQHRYVFRLYALDDETGLAYGASREEVEHAMRGHVIEQCQLIGRYARQNADASARF